MLYINLHIFVLPDDGLLVKPQHAADGWKTQVLFDCYIYHISWPIRRTVIFSLEILEKNNIKCSLILVIYWKKTGLLHTKISNHKIIYSS
jgi:hypothetical protein